MPKPSHCLSAINKNLLFSKSDVNDQRLGDLTAAWQDSESVAMLRPLISKATRNTAPDSGPQNIFAIIGYPDDEGIQINGGRLGASEAPDRIRNFFYKMTPPAYLPQNHTDISLNDIGNLAVSGPLEQRHAMAREIISEFQSSSFRTISFGGGHDYGYPDAAAYCQAALARGERPLVINFDAHLDVRPVDNGYTSGTPFFRLLEEFPNIDLIELGLQSQCNSPQHLEWLIHRGGRAIFEEQRLALGQSLSEALRSMVESAPHAPRTAFLSIDIDGFTSALAPGASQSWPTGFSAQDFFECFSWCIDRFDVRGIGIYEVSPPLDIDNRTSRLAALIAHRFVFRL